jgi:hypothetical protein
MVTLCDIALFLRAYVFDLDISNLSIICVVKFPLIFGLPLSMFTL